MMKLSDALKWADDNSHGEQHGMPLRIDTTPAPSTPTTQEPQINLEGYREAGSSLAGDDGGSRAWSEG